ncbi:MAG: aldehyde dehydrogenase family protein [Wolbachia sp.]
MIRCEKRIPPKGEGLWSHTGMKNVLNNNFPILRKKKVSEDPNDNLLMIENSNFLQQKAKKAIVDELQKYGVKILHEFQFPQYISNEDGVYINLATKVGPILGQYIKPSTYVNEIKIKQACEVRYDPIDFRYVFACAQKFSTYLKHNQGKIIQCLQSYECLDVAVDEIKRSVDLLDNLNQNSEYFKAQVSCIVSFLPLNQPLYSSVCFGCIMSLMAKTAIIRPPTVMKSLFENLTIVSKFNNFFPNLIISYDDKNEFIQKNRSVADVVVFTGKYYNAQKVKKQFKENVLFIFNGAGHNPIVVSKDANIDKVIDSICRVCLQNQGQDCAAPNSILVHSKISNLVVNKCIQRLDLIKNCIGDYANYNNIIGPNTDCSHALKIARVLYENRNFLQYGGEINPATGLIKPTVLVKPLLEGGNFSELFAPVIILQPYETDEDLKMYFEHSNYKSHAMYVTLFGTSKYVEILIEKGLHTRDNILRDTDLHVEERGFKPYGGLGIEASCIQFYNKIIPGATLPQRDIYTYLIGPSIERTKGISISH